MLRRGDNRCSIGDCDHQAQRPHSIFPGGFPTPALGAAGYVTTGRHPKPFTGPDLVLPLSLTPGPAPIVTFVRLSYLFRICLMRAIASSTAYSGLMAATRWTALAQTRSRFTSKCRGSASVADRRRLPRLHLGLAEPPSER